MRKGCDQEAQVLSLCEVSEMSLFACISNSMRVRMSICIYHGDGTYASTVCLFQFSHSVHNIHNI